MKGAFGVHQQPALKRLPVNQQPTNTGKPDLISLHSRWQPSQGIVVDFHTGACWKTAPELKRVPFCRVASGQLAETNRTWVANVEYSNHDFEVNHFERDSFGHFAEILGSSSTCGMVIGGRNLLRPRTIFEKTEPCLKVHEFMAYVCTLKDPQSIKIHRFPPHIENLPCNVFAPSEENMVHAFYGTWLLMRPFTCLP